MALDHDVTLLIPHFQTLDAVRLCLRAIRRYTEPLPRILVLDNGSSDASIDYLRELRWIECVETRVPNDIVAAQAAALDLGVARVETAFFAVLHSDTYVHRRGWLAALTGLLARGAYAAVGSRHQTIRAHDWRALARLATWSARLLSAPRRSAMSGGLPRLRSCLTLYRSDAFRAAGCRFASSGDEDATHSANARLIAYGGRLLALPAGLVGYYVFHKGDTTRIANRLYRPDDVEFRARIARHQRHVGRFRARPAVQALLADASLDRYRPLPAGVES